MEPYITSRDYYSAEIGHPDISSEYINSFELNYKKNIGEHTVSATVFHRSRKDKIERLRVPYEAGVTLDAMANVGHDYSTGLESVSYTHLDVYKRQVKAIPIGWSFSFNAVSICPPSSCRSRRMVTKSSLVWRTQHCLSRILRLK